MRDIGTAKEDKRRAIAAAGAAIAKGYENLGSAVNFMGMTRGQGGVPAASQNPLAINRTTAISPAQQNDFYDPLTGQSLEITG